MLAMHSVEKRIVEEETWDVTWSLAMKDFSVTAAE